MRKSTSIIHSGAALLVAFLTACSTSGRFTVEAGDYDREDCLVRMPVKKDTKHCSLVETTNGQKTPVACQVVEEGDSCWLYFTMAGSTSAGSVRTYRYTGTRPTAEGHRMGVEDNGKSLTLTSGGKSIMTYNYTLSEVPQGVRKVYERSGYIHPACTPSGFVYTNIQPVDHRHHYGIWNPWTRVEYDNQTYDLWNLGDSLGTVRADKIEETYQGEVLTGFNAKLKHIIFSPEGEKAIMDEEWQIKAVENGNGYLWDFVSILEPCAENPVTIKAYRYQGFSCRATDVWTRENCRMRTSEGLERPEIDATTARWIYVNGNIDNQESGFMFMSYPDNYNTPEPLRIWNQDSNGGRGDVYVNFCPTKTADWKLEPGRKYVLRYRVYAYDGEMSDKQAERLWTDFAHPPTIKK